MVRESARRPATGYYSRVPLSADLGSPSEATRPSTALASSILHSRHALLRLGCGVMRWLAVRPDKYSYPQQLGRVGVGIAYSFLIYVDTRYNCKTFSISNLCNSLFIGHEACYLSAITEGYIDFMTIRKSILMAAIGCCALIGQHAYAFSGTVTMGSSNGKSNVTVKNSVKKGTTTVTFGTNWKVLAGSGDYTGTTGAAVTYTSFTYTTATGSITSPAAPFTLWSFVSGGKTYTFALDNPITQNTNTATFFQITGTGIGYINGKDPTTGSWSLTGSPSGTAFKFVSSSVTTFVPDGGSAVALLGIALAGIEGVRKVIRVRKV